MTEAILEISCERVLWHTGHLDYAQASDEAVESNMLRGGVRNTYDSEPYDGHLI